MRGLVYSAAELQERDLIKMAALAATIGRALQLREVQDRTVTLAAQAAIAHFTVAYSEWIDGPNDDLDAIMQHSLADFRRAVAAG